MSKVQATRSKQANNAQTVPLTGKPPNEEPQASHHRLPGRTYSEATKSGNVGASTHGIDASTATSHIEELLIKLINQNETMMQLLQTVILKLVDEQR